MAAPSLALESESPPLFSTDPAPIPADVVEKFATLFQGGTSAYITFTINPAGDPEYNTVRAEVTPEVYARHLDGGMTLGICPLTEGGMTCFAALDFDTPDIEGPERCKRLLAAYDIRSYLEPSKTKGTHLWLFFAEPVSATHVRQVLQLMLLNNDCPSDTEIFPKQDRLLAQRAGEKAPLGSAINLPYPGDHAPGRRVVFPDRLDGAEWGVEEFVNGVVRNASALLFKILPNPVSPEDHRQRSRELVARSGNGYTGPNPACIVAALAEPVGKGHRHNVGMRLAQYWLHTRKLDEDAVWEQLCAWNAGNDPPMSEQELFTCMQGLDSAPSCTWLRKEGVFSAACIWERCNFYRPEQQAPRIDAAVVSEATAVNLQDALPAFPLDTLPGVVRDYILEGATAKDVDPAFIAVPMLAAVGATLGTTHWIEAGPTWREPANIFSAVVAKPGGGKSPANTLALAPLYRLQREGNERYRELKEGYRAEYDAWSASPRANRGREPEPPAFPNFVTTDSTMEKLVEMLSKAPRGILYDSDELSSWVTSCDLYHNSNGSDRNRWLSFWPSKPIKVDRKGGETVVVDYPAICVTGGMQPDRLSDLADKAGRQDGFIDRILFAMPADHAPELRRLGIQRRTEADLHFLWGQLYQRTPSTVQMPDETWEIFKAWHDGNCEQLDQAPPLFAGYYNKMPAHTLRLALLLHVLKHPVKPPVDTLDTATMANAIRLGEYFRAHAEAVLRLIWHRPAQSAPPEDGSEERVFTIIAGAADWMSKSALQNALHRNWPVAKLDAALKLLLDTARIEERPAPEAGAHRRATEYRAHLVG